MAILKYKDLQKMSESERKTKMLELKLELVKAYVSANRTNSKTKEIKRSISRLITFNKSTKEELKNK